MEVKIGVHNAPREIVVDVDATQEEIEALVTKAIAGGVLDLSEAKGRRVLIAGERISYVEMGRQAQGTVGFR
ncbi:DUF3107 domain-containing protein [Nocardioides yefusunii]|uniref:DUF3107 domain-containing protein n=1 Tax=Nocardioides yefusunii TaxID=2500546 RepID=A0ABW1R0U7_9ACTN|nr:DUF3107 domain-containing protein [Nocardioides yefusunii]